MLKKFLNFMKIIKLQVSEVPQTLSRIYLQIIIYTNITQILPIPLKSKKNISYSSERSKVYFKEPEECGN